MAKLCPILGTGRSLLVDSSSLGSSSCQPAGLESAEMSSSYQPPHKHQGKSTKRNMGKHKSIFETDVIPNGTTLSYIMHGKICLQGYKTKEGIRCMCCEKVISASKFEKHAGFSFRKKPHMCIYTPDRVSLHRLSADHSTTQEHSPNEPDTRHNSIVEVCIDEINACAICRGHDFSKSGFNGRTVIYCDQCEKEYHVSCLKEQKIADLKALPKGEWFCCKQCSSIHSSLKKLIGDGMLELPEPISDILKKKLVGHGSPPSLMLDIKWRLLKGKKACEDQRVWLSDAVKIFHDQFDPIVDSTTVDLIPRMVYGKDAKHNDFCGMYCAVLMVNSIVVSAGLIRIFGEELAELPLVATKRDYQGKGWFQSLFYCIEHLLSTFNVKDIILPAAADAESMWRNKFGFEKLDQDRLDRYNQNYPKMVVFEGTSILHKSISKS